MNFLIDRFIIEQYEIKVIDKKGPPEESHKEDRWKVKFGENAIAQNFLTEEIAREYIRVHGYLALWNALWTHRFPIQWDQSLNIDVDNFKIEVKFKEKKNGD